MKKIMYLCLLTSSLLADIPGAGRPNPGAFQDESKETLARIEKKLDDNYELLDKLFRYIAEVEHMHYKIIVEEKDSLELIQNFLKKTNALLKRQEWHREHAFDEEMPDSR
jgi:hypothetical protein